MRTLQTASRLINRAGRVAQRFPRNAFARRLHRGLARAAVLLVLTALADIAALDFVRVRFSPRSLRCTCAFRGARTPPRAWPGRRCPDSSTRFRRVSRVVVVFRLVVTNPDDDVDVRVHGAGRHDVVQRAVGIELPARVIRSPRPVFESMCPFRRGARGRLSRSSPCWWPASRSSVVPSGSVRVPLGAPSMKADSHGAVQNVVPVGDGEQVVHHPLDAGVRGVQRFLAAANSCRRSSFGGGREHQREAERGQQQHRHHAR